MGETVVLKNTAGELQLTVTDTGAFLEGGVLNSLEIGRAPLTRLVLKRLADGEELTVDSFGGFRRTAVSRYRDRTRITLFDPLDGTVRNFCVVIQVQCLQNRVEWQVSVQNDSTGYSVINAEYPMLNILSSQLDVFVPISCGLEEKDAVQRSYHIQRDYPQGWAGFNMQYTAFYTAGKGIYAGVHDRTGALKNFCIDACKENSSCTLATLIPAPAMERGANAFALPGRFVWQAMDGDWYDAANIYREFVRAQADWLPALDETGRTDTPAWMKELPFWVMDWMPNGPHKKDELPTSIRPKNGQPMDPTAWIEKPIRLQKELGTPIGYHLYNWHMIPFNNDYPHFWPPQPGAFEGVRQLRENNIYVMPYINGLLWDTRDREDEDYLFTAVAKEQAVRLRDGNLVLSSYESREKDGEKVRLAAMCPSGNVWKTQLSHLVDQLVNELGVPAVCIDQVAACPPMCCTNPAHNHLPGGGDWWVREYLNMLQRFQAEIGDAAVLTSECEGEPYMKELDGFLTWVWLEPNSVPAYSRVYAGLITLFGRNSGGVKKEDDLYFRHSIASSLVYGQQLGWINADVVDAPARMAFLKKLVQLRYACTDYFNRGDMLRPPVVECDIPDVETEPQRGCAGVQKIRAVVSGGWKLWDGSGARLFAVNLAAQPVEAVLYLDEREYGDMPCDTVKQGSGRVISVRRQGGQKIVRLCIAPEDYVVL